MGLEKIYINEKDVAKQIYLDHKPWRRKLIIFVTILIIITSSILIWGYGFKGFLYLETKKWVKNFYNQVVVNLNETGCLSDQILETGLISCVNLVADLKEMYSNPEQRYKYLAKLYTVESNASLRTGYVYFIITNSSFQDSRTKIRSDEQFSPAIFFEFKEVSSFSLKLSYIKYKK